MAQLVSSMKQAIKQILVNQQHKRYQTELEMKKLTYDKWIRQKEAENDIADLKVERTANCLINETEKGRNGGCNSQNDGEHAKSDLIAIYHITGEKETAVSMKIGVVSYESCVEDFLCELKNIDVDVFFFQNKELSDEHLDIKDNSSIVFALKKLYRVFSENPETILAYGDEDHVQENETRFNPWFKSNWSPDTFLSAFYIGNNWAVRKTAFMMLEDKTTCTLCSEKPAQNLYRLFYFCALQAGGFEKHSCVTAGKGSINHISEVLFHMPANGISEQEYAFSDWNTDLFQINDGDVLTGKRDKIFTVSIIIPSKDNPKVLFQCIHSIIDKTARDTIQNYEIIIVDNGSNEENKAEIEAQIQKLNQEGYVCKYLYEVMQFNFSVMCQKGADAASGEAFLFLNDDMEVLEPDWLEKLVEKAEMSHVGAVGAKLCYPDSTTIQHAGITNLRVGPAHKLQYLSDETVYYYGKNRGVHNVLGVTGACLMVRKKVYEEVGGFQEKLAVAFNDVDLCYSIYEAGYYNVVRNDVMLYHHESLSRGKDGESVEKQQRLLHERDVLYEAHQDIYGRDPFYHKYLTADMLEAEYTAAYRYEVNLKMPWSRITSLTELLQKAQEDQCVVIGMECAMDIYKWQYGVEAAVGKTKIAEDEMGYYFQGYSFIIGADNACYSRTILLREMSENKVLGINIEDCYRQDIKDNLREQLNVDLTGYTAKLRMRDIPQGIYQFGMLVEDRCSRQKLYNWSNWTLDVH